jgi:hypothetical protein
MPTRQGHVALLEIRMKKEMKRQALRMITRVSANPSLEPGQRDQLLRARRELERVMTSGKVDQHKLYRAVEAVAVALQQIIEH